MSEVHCCGPALCAVKACDFGYEPGKWDSHNPDLSVKNFPIIPWNLARDRYSLREGCRFSFRLTVKNDGPVPAFPVRPDTVDDGTVCAMEDSFFFLRPGEERVLRGDVLLGDNAPEVPTLRLNAWNAPAIDLLLK